MNYVNEFTTDPTNKWNYVICPHLIDPSKGTTPQEIRKFKIAKVAAVAIKVFLAIITLGISIFYSFLAMYIRTEEHEIKFIERVGGQAIARPALLGRVLTTARILAKQADALNNPNPVLLRHQVVTACKLTDRLGNMNFDEPEINILTEALSQTTKVHQLF